MTSTTNLQYRLAKRPTGEPADDCFELREVPVEEPGDGQALVEAHFLSVDPYMRGRMRDSRSYAEPIAIGGIIIGESVGRVVASKSKKYREGDALCVQSGWQTHCLVADDNAAVMPLDTSLAPIQAYLGVAGMPGRTAYFGLNEVGKPQAGETLVVSAASGAVGSVVGQLAREQGLRVIGVAGGPEKCSYCTDELGFDACVDYKAGNLAADLARACPEGVDIYFENVGGEVTKAVAGLLNPGSRVPICGFVSLYNAEYDNLEEVETPFSVFGALPEPPEHRFFVVTEWQDRAADTSRKLAEMVATGTLKYRESIIEGFANTPAALRAVLGGGNFGKQLVRIK